LPLVFDLNNLLNYLLKLLKVITNAQNNGTNSSVIIQNNNATQSNSSSPIIGPGGLNGTNSTNGNSSLPIGPGGLNGTNSTNLGPNNNPNQPPVPGPKPAPSNVPVNAFANIDPRIPQLLLSFLPNTYTTPSQAASVNQSVFLQLIGSLPKSAMQSNCRSTNLLYQFLEDQIVLMGDNGTIVTSNLIQLASVCKPDCNFNRLLSASSVYTGYCNSGAQVCNTTAFALQIVNALPPQAATQCKQMFPSLASSLAGSLNASNPAGLANALSSNPSQISFMRPDQLLSAGSASPAAALSIAQSLQTGGISLSPIMAKSLGQNIPANTNVTGIASIASGIPLACFDNAQPNDLLNSLPGMDLSNMSPQRQNYIGKKIVAGFLNSSNGLASITSFLKTSSNQALLSAISSSQLVNLGLNSLSSLANISANNLPKSFVIIYIKFCKKKKKNNLANFFSFLLKVKING
jgi:hypothetical protein